MSSLLHDLFYQAVTEHENRTAIVDEQGNKTSYGDLCQLSQQFAHLFLQLKGGRENIRKKPFIGIISSVRTNSIAAVLGCLKIGAAYLPLDEQSPPERVEKIVEESQLDVIVVDPAYHEKFNSIYRNDNIRQIVFSETGCSDVNNHKIIPFSSVQQVNNTPLPNYNQVSDDLAYILHSSGSTGSPKGIMLSHRNARTFVDWMQKEFKLNANDRVMSRAPFKFDLSVFDIFNTFAVGATLVCYDWNRRRDKEKRHKDYVDLLVREEATVLYTTPSTVITLINLGDLEANAGKIKLRTFMYAGEPFPVERLKQFKKIVSPDCRVTNIYGPTETNIITCYRIDDIPDDMDHIPIGTEVDDTEILVVDNETSRLCDPYQVGELWCRGGTVALGYFGKKRETESVRVRSPFHRYPATFWRTGDYGFRDKDGILHYRGRVDHMVKINGYRIELGEIETTIGKCDQFAEFAVVVDSTKKLVCHYVSDREPPVSIEQLKNSLAQKLPPYMIPSLFVHKTELAKTSSGKIDRVLLAKEENR